MRADRDRGPRLHLQDRGDEQEGQQRTRHHRGGSEVSINIVKLKKGGINEDVSEISPLGQM